MTMLASYLYGSNKLDKDTFVTAFLSLMIQGEDGIENDSEDFEPDHQTALQGLADVISSLWQKADSSPEDEIITVEPAERLFRETWVKSYATTLKRSGFDTKLNLKDEKAVADYIEAGNSPDWGNPVARGEIRASRWLLVQAAKVQGEVDAKRSASFYRGAKLHNDKMTDETRDIESKGN
jgi:hypothetical protein